jgi:hypothetical protein
VNTFDKILLDFFGWLDNIFLKVENFLLPKKKKKKNKKCKSCHCNCHCEDDLHVHFDDQDLCACEGCLCMKN